MKRLRVLICLAVLPFLPVEAAMPVGGEGNRDAEKKEAAVERKQSSMWHRARMKLPGEQLEYARGLRDKGWLKDACGQYDALVHTWGGSQEAVSAQMELAETLEKRGRYSRSFDEYQYLMEHYAGSFPHEAVLDRQFRIANHVMTARCRVLWIFPRSGSPDDALPMFERIVINGPTWGETALAQYSIGLIHESQGDYELAIGAYENLAQRYRANKIAVDADFRMSLCRYLVASRSRYEERRCNLALAQLKQFLRDHPGHEQVGTAAKYVADLSSHLSRMYYERAVFYDRRARKPKAALLAYGDFVNRFPDDEMAGRARQRMAALQKAAGASPGSEGPHQEEDLRKLLRRPDGGDRDSR